ncbi:hypothetical protein PHYBOEH_006637 [Phytophthora boehmeriae]|uniref:Uncharacterized protein n=1 Tax=Phytophthora boehmeriae TaxID=109152 RepID=A0A8T1WHT0_9STRA|nr:hypothetical protein PHYBOEH_006637 [Phytophthora boehmeriae]
MAVEWEEWRVGKETSAGAFSITSSHDGVESIARAAVGLGGDLLTCAFDCSEDAVRAQVSSDVPKTGVDIPAALRALSKALSAALDTPMLLQGSDEVKSLTRAITF